jgi:hypothetical protein
MNRDIKIVLTLIGTAIVLVAMALAVVYRADRPQPVRIDVSTQP